ncbi:MAG TPA: hypothetical protein ENN87_03735 [Phycisphaerales bacterium]|nr:hypothetical protein [Phycisphaerales bacterium]
MADEAPSDVMIQLGVGFLGKLYALAPELGYWGDRFEQVIRLDPNHCPAYASLARGRAMARGTRRDILTDYVEGKIAYAADVGLQSLRVEKVDPHFEVFSAYGRLVEPGPPAPQRRSFMPYVELDFEAARQALQNTLNTEAQETLRWLRTVQQKDPENALYDYLIAYLLLELGQPAEALEQMEVGNAKPYLRTYYAEKQAAMKKVLELADVPENEVAALIDTQQPFEDFIATWLWRRGLAAVVEDCKDRGDIGKTRRIYQLMLRAVDQCQPEQFAPMNTGVILRQRLASLPQSGARPSDVSGIPRNPSQGPRRGYWLLGLIFILVLGGVAWVLLHHRDSGTANSDGGQVARGSDED